VWEQIAQELAPHGLQVVTVALDDDAEAARPWVLEAGLTGPAALDPNHAAAELFGIINVSTSVWFDETGAMVRPPQIAYADDRFREFHGIDSSIHHNLLRRWVIDGEPPDPALMARWHQPAADDAATARAHRRVAAVLHRRGLDDAALVHFERARELAQFDWTIRRGSLPLTGSDPFGNDFFTFAVEWSEAGSPGYAE
jgi:hypothetical protein